MRHARRFLTATILGEAVVLRQHAPTPTQADLQDGGPIRNVPLMRDENSYNTGNVESSWFSDCVLGLLTVGWALHTPTQSQREQWPTTTIQDLFDIAHGRLLIPFWMKRHGPKRLQTSSSILFISPCTTRMRSHATSSVWCVAIVRGNSVVNPFNLR